LVRCRHSRRRDRKAVRLRYGCSGGRHGMLKVCLEVVCLLLLLWRMRCILAGTRRVSERQRRLLRKVLLWLLQGVVQVWGEVLMRGSDQRRLGPLHRQGG